MDDNTSILLDKYAIKQIQQHRCDGYMGFKSTILSNLLYACLKFCIIECWEKSSKSFKNNAARPFPPFYPKNDTI